MRLAETQFGKFYYFENDCLGRSIVSGPFYDEHLRPFFDALHEGDVLVDVGANIGFFTVYAAVHRRASVVAFEASTVLFSVLEKNIAINGVRDRVLAYPIMCRCGIVRRSSEFAQDGMTM